MVRDDDDDDDDDNDNGDDNMTAMVMDDGNDCASGLHTCTGRQLWCACLPHRVVLETA